MPERRQLIFDRIEAVAPDLDRLIAGHATVGWWTLGAICDHLARTINLSLDLAPANVPATREQQVNRRLFFRAPVFPEGQSIPLLDQHPIPDADLTQSSNALRSAILRLVAHDGPSPPHPRLGPLSRDEWIRFHSRHCAHHLSFAIPL